MQVSTEITDRESALAYLLSRIDYERSASVSYREDDFRLDRMRELLDRIGNPQLGLPIVHLAGTKGKGSTAGMIASVLSASGYRTGLYTSPHLQRVEERFSLDGVPCPSARFVELAVQVRRAVDEMDRRMEMLGAQKCPTFFEITTAMALLHFATARAEAAVLEVGLGGRLDSTNVCQPEISIITTISFDHMSQLGNTLAAIATEKAGIIKPSVPVVSGVVAQEPREVITRIARERGARLYVMEDDFDFTYARDNAAARLDYRERIDGRERRLEDVKVGLLGRHQAANAATALATLGRLSELGWSVSEQATREGLATVRCPARVEVVATRPTVIIDVAHNVAAIDALCQVLDEGFPADRRVLIFAASRDKDVRGMLRLVLPRFQHVVLTRYLENPRSFDPEALLEFAETIHSENPGASATCVEVASDPASAWQRACELATPEHLVCITGSFFIAAETQAVIIRAGNRRADN